MAGDDEDRGVDFGVVDVKRDNVAVVDFEKAGAGGTEERGIVPCQLGDRIRQLLEPAVVGVAAIPKC